MPTSILSQSLLGFLSLGSLALIIATGAQHSLFLPYSRGTSIFDFIVTEAFLSGAALVAALRSTGQEGTERATAFVTGAAAIVVAFAATKALTLDWGALSKNRAVSSGLLLGLGAACSVVAALLQRFEQKQHRREQDGIAEKYRRFLDDKGEEDDVSMKLSIWQVVKTLRPYFWPHSTKGRVSVIMTWVFVSLSKATSVIAPIFIARGTNQLSNGKIEESMRSVVYYGILLFVSKVTKEFQSLVYLNVKQAAFSDLAQDVFVHVHKLSLQWHLKKKLGEVVRVIDRGISACDTFMNYGVLYLGPAIAECASVIILFFAYFKVWALASVVLFSLATYAYMTIKLTLWRKQFRADMNKSDNKWHDRITDSLVNFETVKYFTNETYEVDRFGDAVKSYQKFSVSVSGSLSVLNISQQFVLNTCLATSLVLGAAGYKQGNLNVGDFVAINVWIVQLFTPLNFLGTVYNALITAWVDLTNLSELLGQQPDIVDAAGAQDLVSEVSRGSGSSGARGVSVAFENVQFAYPTGSGRGLKGISFEVPPGTTTAIVGTTGAGKTTVGRLLFRFMDPNSGRVLVGGCDTQNVSQASLRSVIGVVPQDTVLFNDTILHNVMYGKLDATIAEAEEACAGAQILDFIKALPEGWDTMVGERGLKLSGGEKQRVAIARALLKNPPVVLLDEATSALDSITERSVQDALNKLGKHRTVLVIAHRLGTIQSADQIVVLSDGIIIERGSHHELLAKSGAYAQMWATQAKAAQSLVVADLPSSDEGPEEAPVSTRIK